MQKWLLHEQALRNPPTDRMRAVHMLHQTQSVPMLDENSALRGNMPQRNEEEGGKKPRLSFSPAASVWGQMGRAWKTDGRNTPRTTESITDKDYVAFLESICNAAGFATNHKRVLTSAGNRRADLEIRNIRGAADRLASGRHRWPQFQRHRSQWADSRPALQPRQPG